MIKFLRNLVLKFFLKLNSSPTFLGISNHQLDIDTMTYRFFGAVWKFQNGYRYIIGYWFAESKEELMNIIETGHGKKLIKQNEQINEVYFTIREKQELELWQKRIKLSNKVVNQAYWRRKKTGWYLIKSNKNFPCLITCFQKTNKDIWIKHIAICEFDYDLKRIINLINLENGIQLNPEEIK
ncbi:hypothetical protein [Gottfriedia luciferensis]|uniref:hypothetical protein n=1 Tax=Gottfriedia luciferensis TaxID=178774 RepID=UPI000B432BFD|nr:hypothetical protein [Gottfriedia luciferensis]